MKSLVCFVLTAVLWVLAGVFIFKFIDSVKDATDSNMVRLEAPGKAVFTAEKEGVVTLWHDYQTMYNGSTISNDSALPGGFSFELRAAGASTSVPFVSSGMTSNMTTNGTAKSGVGSFEVPGPGDYELTISAPPGETRIFSLSEGTMMEGFGSLFGLMGGAMLAGLAGLVTLILAIVFLFTGKKKASASPPPYAA